MIGCRCMYAGNRERLTPNAPHWSNVSISPSPGPWVSDGHAREPVALNAGESDRTSPPTHPRTNHGGVSAERGGGAVACAVQGAARAGACQGAARTDESR